MALSKKTNAFRILTAYKTAGSTGLNAEEAAYAADLNLRSCYWKRVSELVALGFLAVTTKKRTADSGRGQAVNKITPAGRAHLKFLNTGMKRAA